MRKVADYVREQKLNSEIPIYVLAGSGEFCCRGRRRLFFPAVDFGRLAFIKILENVKTGSGQLKGKKI